TIPPRPGGRCEAPRRGFAGSAWRDLHSGCGRCCRGGAMTGDTSRKPKKSETLEVRLPYETKQAFLTACREDGTTASEVVRGSIDDYLDERGRPETETQPRSVIAMIPAPIRNKRYLAVAGGLAGLAALVALPSAADPDFMATFHKFDKN